VKKKEKEQKGIERYKKKEKEDHSKKAYAGPSPLGERASRRKRGRKT